MSSYIRLFVAVELPQSVKQELIRIQKMLQAKNCFDGQYVDPERAHITLKFIGSVKTNELESIKNALAVVSLTPCIARLDKIGFFCEDDFIKVIYVNVIAPTLPKLVIDLDPLLLPWCQSEKLNFVSHVTIARVKHVQDKQCLVDTISSLSVEPIIFEINSFVLKQSILKHTGPEYRTLKTFNF
jgi:2'-5' RNA ligase